MAEQIIQTATASDEASIIAVMALAFSADPAARWTWPDPQQYLRHFPGFVMALGGKAFAHGSAYYVDGYEQMAALPSAGAALVPAVHRGRSGSTRQRVRRGVDATRPSSTGQSTRLLTGRLKVRLLHGPTNSLEMSSPCWGFV
jgi:hypothetical protein